ncbi:MAG: putative sporulation protein [Ilumatobacteraceae bacterium]|nr:putative sporulation protein [Ilumatobacteraceae bacterium]
MAQHPLIEAVGMFIDSLSDELSVLSGRPTSTYRGEVTIEAANIVAGVIAADGRLTSDEAEGYLNAVGQRLVPPLLVSSMQLRASGMLAGRDAWLDTPSVLFDLLVRADAKAHTMRSHRYYALALGLAHMAAALDLVPSASEIDAIDAFRTMLLHRLDASGVPRPGQPVPNEDVAYHVPGPPERATVGSRAAAAATVPSIDAPEVPARPLVELLAALDQLVGLADVKAEVRRLTSLLQVQQLRAERGLPTMETSHHLVFTGNPGTGKTTVARLLSQIYRSVGVVAKGQLVETDRSKLVAGFIGQTALKTSQALEAALGGMLLIDEAYALARGGDNDFGREAIDTVVKFMEDHRDDIAIVAAGYPAEMATFIDANPGLKSRFTRTIEFPDYTDVELVSIFLSLGARNQYECSDDALAALRVVVAAEPRTRGFGNARFVRNLFEAAVAHQAMRVAPLSDPSNEQLTTFTAADIAAVDV